MRKQAYLIISLLFLNEEISSSILKIASESNEIDWDEFVLDVKDFIVSTYNNGALSKFKGEWKRRFKIMAETMGYTIGSTSGDVDSWRLVEEELKKIKSKTKSTSGSSTVSSNYAVTEEEKQKILYQYSKQADSKKWILSTGKIVEDTMKAVVENSKFEHPVFSFILDPSDLTWFKHFTKEELNEIRSHRGVNLPKVKEDFQKYLDSFDNPDFQTADDFYDYAKEQKFPLREYEKRWAQETFVSVAQLFAECDILSLNDFSEHDMLHQIWPFAYKLFSGSNIKAKLGERCSVANSLRRNEGRCLESELRRAPKKIGAKVDMLFQEGAHELGCCEVGKSNVAIVDNKYLDDGMLKQPKILRDILSALISVNPSKINDLYSVGFLMMGE
jgi:hypothetical protein